MKLSLEQVEHLADLARIRLTDLEKVKFRDQLSGVLKYVNKLGELDTAGVEPTSRVAGLENVWREDHPEERLPGTRELLMKNVPEREGDLVKVKGVFGVTPDGF